MTNKDLLLKTKKIEICKFNHFINILIYKITSDNDCSLSSD